MKILAVHNFHRAGSASGDDQVFKHETALLEANGHQVIRYSTINDTFDKSGPLGKVKAAFGIEEPSTDCSLMAKEDVDLVLTPAVAYDEQGFRMGFGGGYYDRWLPGCPGVRIGLCRERVLQKNVPVEPHDAQVDKVVTERGIIRCR